ncbi:MAG: hypothetical protein AB1810_04480 [Pseudomonadota bacterium]
MISLLQKRRYGVVLLLAVYLVIRCFYLDAVPRWDAASYWGALMQAVHSTKTLQHASDFPAMVLKEWNAYGHPSMGYYSILVLGQLIDFPNQFILNFTNILLAMFSILCVYKILLWFFPDRKHYPEVLLVTAAYAFEPLFFGCSIYLNTDFPVLVFFTAALASLLYGHYGFFAIASIFMVFSKDPGIIYWASLVGGLGLYVLWFLVKELRNGRFPPIGEWGPPSHYHNGQPLKLWPVMYRVFCLMLPAIAFIWFSVAREGVMWENDTGLKWDSNGWNCFGFNKRVMANRAGEIFVLDFHWIPLAVALVVFLIWIGRYIERKNNIPIENSVEPRGIAGNSKVQVIDKNMVDPSIEDTNTTEISVHNSNHVAGHKSFGETDSQEINRNKKPPTEVENRWWGMLPIFFAFATFLAFNMTYITFIIPRYVVLSGFFLLMCAIFAMHFGIHSQRVRISIMSVILVLFIAQTFRTVDPLSKLAFGTAPFNDHEILQIDSPGEAVGNGFVYNAEFSAVDKLFNMMAKAIPLRPDTQIIAWETDPWYPWFFGPLRLSVRWIGGTPFALM